MKAFKSKTVLFGLLLTIAGFVQTNLPSLQLDPQVQGWATMIIGIIVIVLRAVTTTGLANK